MVPATITYPCECILQHVSLAARELLTVSFASRLKEMNRTDSLAVLRYQEYLALNNRMGVM